MGLILAVRQCKILPKIIPKIYLKRVFRELILGVWGPHFEGLGASFWSHFGGLGGVWLPRASWEASWVAPGLF